MTDARKLIEDYVAECLPESGQDGSPFTVTLTYAQWRKILAALRQLHLAQTENAGHIRIEDELKSDLVQAQARCAELEKALARIANGVENGESFSGTYCAGIARDTLKNSNGCSTCPNPPSCAEYGSCQLEGGPVPLRIPE